MERQRLLIVDNEVKWLATLKAFFEGRGYLVWAVTSGEAALQVLTQHQPQVVLLDMQLGASRLHGLDVLRQIKTHWAGIAVLVCSGSADADKKTEALSLGADRFFDKPVNLVDLLRAIQAVNGRRQP